MNEETEQEEYQRRREEDALWVELGEDVAISLLYDWNSIDGQVLEQRLEQEYYARRSR
jgi:hypothetical protein